MTALIRDQLPEEKGHSLNRNKELEEQNAQQALLKQKEQDAQQALLNRNKELEEQNAQLKLKEQAAQQALLNKDKELERQVAQLKLKEQAAQQALLNRIKELEEQVAQLKLKEQAAQQALLNKDKELERQIAQQALQLNRIKELEEQVKELQSRLGLSSKPPSLDQKPNRQPHKKKGIKRAYHSGAVRKLLPSAMVTSRVTRMKEVCPNCGASMVATGRVRKSQQVELPKIKPLVCEYELKESRCIRCQQVHYPRLEPHEKPLLGAYLESFSNLLMVKFRQSHRGVRKLIRCLIPELELSQGLISKIKRRAAQALKPIVQDLHKQIINSDKPIHVDATGWRHEGLNQHLIVARAGPAISFRIEPHQNRETLSKLFNGERSLNLVTDRGLATGWLKKFTHQFCLSHLLRNIQGIAEHQTTSPIHSQMLRKLYDILQLTFVQKHRLDRGEIQESTWRNSSYLYFRMMKEICEKILDTNPSPKLQRWCNKVLRNWKQFFVYIRDPDRPMTNNPAEEALRPLVIARKLSFGSASEYGKHWVENMYSFTETLNRLSKPSLKFLPQVLSAHRQGKPMLVMPANLCLIVSS